jgi:hypothetical protein
MLLAQRVDWRLLVWYWGFSNKPPERAECIFARRVP